MGALDDAIGDFDAVLKVDPKAAMSLYGRGIAKRLKGDATGSDGDLEAALAIQPSVADEMAIYGIK
jgi:hypothetical protein